jgi:hypothetical protein
MLHTLIVTLVALGAPVDKLQFQEVESEPGVPAQYSTARIFHTEETGAETLVELAKSLFPFRLRAAETEAHVVVVGDPKVLDLFTKIARRVVFSNPPPLSLPGATTPTATVEAMHREAPPTPSVERLNKAVFAAAKANGIELSGLKPSFVRRAEVELHVEFLCETLDTVRQFVVSVKEMEASAAVSRLSLRREGHWLVKVDWSATSDRIASTPDPRPLLDFFLAFDAVVDLTASYDLSEQIYLVHLNLRGRKPPGELRTTYFRSKLSLFIPADISPGVLERLLSDRPEALFKKRAGYHTDKDGRHVEIELRPRLKAFQIAQKS